MADTQLHSTEHYAIMDDEPECDLHDFELSYVDEEYDDNDDPDLSYILDGRMDPKENQFYILGTLIVRVAGARELKVCCVFIYIEDQCIIKKASVNIFLVLKSTQPMITGGLSNLFSSSNSMIDHSRSKSNTFRTQQPSIHRTRKFMDKGSSNPYAILRFGNQTQRTTVAPSTIDPVWPREEQYYFDLSLPVMHLTHNSMVPMDDEKKNTTFRHSTQRPVVPIVHISLYHAENYQSEYSEKKKKGNTSTATHDNKQSQDPLLGYTTLDVSSILLGKQTCIDEWLSLHVGHEAEESLSTRGWVRLICEYEPTDIPPRPGDMCRFTSLVHPYDIYPLSVSNSFRVDDIIGDDVYISFRTYPENWLSTCKVHRFMVLCEQRHQTAVERYQDEIIQVAEKLIHSPMITVIQEKVEHLPEEGILSLGMETITKSIGLVGRWYQNGISTAVDDVIHVTNWDGRFNPRMDDGDSMMRSHEGDMDFEDDMNQDLSYDDSNHDGVIEEDEDDNRPKLPNCPITGQPMKHPVVAADGVRSFFFYYNISYST